MTPRPIRIGTRSSRLALSQAGEVVSLIRMADSRIKVELVKVTTEGDTDRSTALEKMGGYGLFTKAIERQLLEGRIDIAVHSAKDLPSKLTPGLMISAVPVRESCQDAWLSRDSLKLARMKAGACVGTGSPRRRAQLLYIRPDLDVKDIRGNVDTRLEKLRAGEYAAVIMAHAGLKRIGLQDSSEITELLDVESFLPAPGQGALAVQTRTDDSETSILVESIDDPASHRCLDIERSLLARLNAGCSTPIGALAIMEGDRVRLSAVVLDNDGKSRLYVTFDIAREEDNTSLVDHVADRLFEMGAAELLAERDEHGR